MNCPQCDAPMPAESSRILVDNPPRHVNETHYRCDECDSEYVRRNKVMAKLDGGMVPLGCRAVELANEVEGECQK